MRIESDSAKETIRQGEIYSKTLAAGSIIGLEGDLGTGKTQFVKGICNGFGVREVVNSPTFIIVNEYPCDSGKIFHFDLYRLRLPEELSTIGFDEYIESGSICLIEWPELAEKYLGKAIKKVKFGYGTGENDRIIEIID